MLGASVDGGGAGGKGTGMQPSPLLISREIQKNWIMEILPILIIF